MIRFQLVSLSGVKFDEEVYEVLLPTMEGQIGVLDKHMQLVSVAKPGVISVRKKASDPDDFMERFAVSGGVIEVSKNNVLSVLVDDADHSDELSEAEIQKAMAAAEKMKADAKDQVSLDKAQAQIDRQAVRLQVAGLKKRSRRR